MIKIGRPLGKTFSTKHKTKRKKQQQKNTSNDDCNLK